jgi:circadian clock protein KaiC
MPDQEHEAVDKAEAEPVLHMDSTGVPNLDLVLGGGLSRGSLVLVVGPPGSGKTTLASQMAFAAARTGRKVLILTVLSEPNSKLLAHLRTYRFYDQALIGDRVTVLSLQQFLPSGLVSAAKEVVALARDADASLVVLDGFSGVRSADPDPGAARRFLFEVGSTLGVQGATTIITTEAAVWDPALFPEATTADVILGMHFGVHDERQRRRLEVIKARGAAHLPGLHGLDLSASGIEVSPRLEARVVRAARNRAAEAGSGSAAGQRVVDVASPTRTNFDLPALDTLLDGGLTTATTTIAIGSGGTGKTLLGLHFALAGVRAGQPVVLMGFHEDERQLLLKADAFNLGQDLRAALAPGGGLTLLHYPAVELDADVLADDLLVALDRTRARRLVIDSIAVVERSVRESSGPQRVQNYLSALVTALQSRRVTALFTKETGPLVGAALELETDLSSGVADNLILLQAVIYREQYYRVLSVLKMRYSAHDLTLREFTITSPAGIEVRPAVDSAHGVLAGIARQQGDPRTTEWWLAAVAEQYGRRARRRLTIVDDGPGGSQ